MGGYGGGWDVVLVRLVVYVWVVRLLGLGEWVGTGRCDIDKGNKWLRFWSFFYWLLGRDG